jgi:TonB family protein
MNLTREKIYGYTGSLIFCAIVFAILWFSVLKTIIPSQEEGILVNFGNVDEAAGLFEPQNTGNNGDNVSVEPETPKISTPATPSTPRTVISQNNEQTVSIDTEKKKKEEEQKRQQAINKQVAGAFGAGATSASAGQGTGSGQGNQGSLQGNSDHGANSGIGGYGDFSLAGRSLGPGGLPRPSYSIQEEGMIVVDITVNKNGNVILATIGKGTNIDNATMRQSALEAAKKAKFNAIPGNENQSGKITYRYYLK